MIYIQELTMEIIFYHQRMLNNRSLLNFIKDPLRVKIYVVAVIKKSTIINLQLLKTIIEIDDF